MSDLVKDPGKYTDASSSDVEELKSKLNSYLEKIKKEVTLGQQRSLEIHNTTRECYERQAELIESLLEEMENGEEIIS